MTDASKDEPEQTLVGISFGDAFRAQEFLTAVTRLAANGRLRLKDAVIVHKDESGKTTVRETVDLSPGRGALSGALWAGLFGLLLGGPVGWIVGAGVGAGAGAVSAKVVDHGIPDEWVAWFRDAVKPNTTTLALLVEELDRPRSSRRSPASPGPNSSTPTSTRCGSAASTRRSATRRRRRRRPTRLHLPRPDRLRESASPSTVRSTRELTQGGWP